ncbi:MAG: hypothetical protein AB7F98_16200 [Novosphingobium sp.]
MDPGFAGTGYLLTASAAALGGYAVASMRYAPRLADLAGRVALAEQDLRGQGEALLELSEALRSLLHSLDREADPAARIEAMAAAHRALTRS